MKIGTLLLASLTIAFVTLCIASGIPNDEASFENSTSSFAKKSMSKDTFTASSNPIETQGFSKMEDDRIFLKNAEIDTTSREENEVFAASAEISSITSDTEDYYIVQFKGSIKDEWKRTLKNSGADIQGYVPNNAYLVKMDSSVKSSVESFDYVIWIGKYRSEYKISPELSKSTQITQEIIVILFDPEDNMEVSADIENIGGEILGVSGELIKARMDTASVPRIAALGEVKWIEKHVQPVPLNDVSRDIIGVSYVSDTYNLAGKGQIIGIADSGLDTGINDGSMHDDFEGRIIEIFDLVGDGAKDSTGHGTHVAGSALGNGSLSGGQYRGMAPEAELVFQAFAEDTFGQIVGIPADLTQLFQQSYDEGARIHTNSWGTPVSGQYDTLSYYTDKFMWEHPDMLILFAAGNYGKDDDLNGVIDADSIASPATAKNCISVGASENYRPEINITWELGSYPVNPITDDKKADNTEGIAAFSSRGPTDDGRIKPDIVAPGTFIASTRSSMASSEGWGIIDEDYMYMGGTSMATPITAGAAALVRQNYIGNLNTTPSAALIKATLINGACDMAPGQYGTNSTQEIEGRPDYSQGWGRLDVRESLYPLDERKIYFSDSLEINTDESFESNYYINNSSQPLRVTLVWTDYPAEPYAATTLVNDLDLYVKGPDGKYHKEVDGINNVEQVEIQSPETGLYTVLVDGFNVPQGPQPFALVLSGATSELPEAITLEFAPEYPIITVGENTIFYAQTLDQYGSEIDSDVKWSSSNNEVGVIDESIGEFTALSIGKTNITASVNSLSATAEIMVTENTFSDTEFAYDDGNIEIRSPVFEGNNISEINVSANYNEFPYFYYNLDEGFGTERIYVSSNVTDPRTIDEKGLIYSTEIKEHHYAHKEWGTFDSTGFLGDLYVLISSSPDKFSTLLLDNNDMCILEKNGSLELSNGYALEITEIDSEGNSAFISLTKDGFEVDSGIVSSDSDYVYEKDIGSINDVPIIKAHFNEILRDNETDIVTVQGIFQISSEVLDLGLNDTFAELQLIKITEDHLELANTVPINLEKENTINLTNGIKVKVADSEELRFYFMTNFTDIGSYELRGKIVNSSASNNHQWDPTSFSGFHYDLFKDVLSESLEITTGMDNRTISPGNLVYKASIKHGSYKYGPWNEDENYFKMGFFGKEYAVRSMGDVPLLPPDRLYELVLNDDKKYVLRTGQELDLGKGYTLIPKQIDTKDKKVLLEFAKDGKVIENSTIYENSTWKYLTEVDGYANIEVFRVHISRVCQIDTVEIEGIWLMLNKSNQINIGDVFGKLYVKSLIFDSVTLKNNNSIVLESGNDIDITNELKIRVAESPDSNVRFYPFMTHTISNELRDIKVTPMTIDLVEDEIYDFSAQAFDRYGNELNVTINWTSSNTAVGTINETTGKFCALNAGNTTISAANDDIKGNAVVTVTEKTTSESTVTQSSSSGGSGGGGGGSTGEAYENIEKKEVVSQFISKGNDISYNFDEEENSIDYIKFDSLKNSGKITVTIEVLKNRSQFVNNDPPGEVYQHMNIWVGKTGFATPENIENPVIGFMVKRSWIEKNNIIESSIKLFRNHNGGWSSLSTKKVGDDGEYIYFEAETPGFSPFAITGETEEIKTPEEQVSTVENTDLQQQSFESENNKEPQAENNTLPGWSTLGSFSIIAIASLLMHMRRK